MNSMKSQGNNLFHIRLLISLIIGCMLVSFSQGFAGVIDTSRTIVLSEDTNLNDSLKIRQAFAQILAVNTGESVFEILQNPVFQESDPGKAIKRAYFEEIDKKYLPENSEKRYWYHVLADEDYILDMIQKAGFSILPHKRDEIMLWLVKEEWITHDDEFMLEPEKLLDYAYSDGKFMYWFNHWAESQGLMFKLPQMDESDMLLVTPQSIKTLSYEADEQSRLRYQVQQSLLIYFERESDEIKIRVGYFDKESRISINHYQEAGADESQVLFSVMEGVSQNFARDYKIAATDLQNHTIKMSVGLIDGYDTVRKIEKYFDDLSIIPSYEVIAAEKGSLLLQVQLIVSTEAFLQVLTRDNLLALNPLSNMNLLMLDVKQPEL